MIPGEYEEAYLDSGKFGGDMITYSPDQLLELVGWLEQQRDYELTLEEVIDGLIDGTNTVPIDISE